jgi:hypothetical protein
MILTNIKDYNVQEYNLLVLQISNQIFLKLVLVAKKKIQNFLKTTLNHKNIVILRLTYCHTGYFSTPFFS